MIFKSAGNDVFGHHDADSGCHCALHGEHAWPGDNSSDGWRSLRVARTLCGHALFLVAVQAAEAVKCRGLVALGESGVVEDRVDEVVDGAAQDHHGLADVHQFAGAFADDVDAQNLARVAMEDELEAAGGVAANLAASDFAIEGHADFVGNIFVGELLFGFADEADFGNGVDAVGIEARVGEVARVVEGARGGDAALLHGDRGE